MARRFAGNPPDDGQLLASMVADGKRWYLYERPNGQPGEWRSLKLVVFDIAGKGVPHKANFWLSYRVQAAQMGVTSDGTLLQRYHPAMATWVLHTVQQHPRVDFGQ